LAGLAAERAGAWPAALAHDDGHVLVEVLEAKVGQFGEAHAAVEEQAHDRHVTTFLETLAFTGCQ
jgi:hypothetical protein